MQRWSMWLAYAVSLTGYVTLALFTKRFMGWNFAVVYFAASVELVSWVTRWAGRRGERT